MDSPAGELAGFAYGEHLEGVSRRSLGYRLLAPLPAAEWSAEVEALARRLQAAPYSDHWPATDLFCSVLLSDGRRVVALARYGLADHTPSQRRGGLELIGVVGSAGLSVGDALALYGWLRRRREAADDLHRLGGRFDLGAVLREAPPQTPPADPVPVLPVRLWQEGALLFAASTPSDPDHHLRLLEQAAGASWQWLPLVGADFPLPQFAQRGPLIAWTPHLAGVALKLDRKPAESPAVQRTARLARVARAAVLSLLLALLAGNLASTLVLHWRFKTFAAQAPAPAPAAETHKPDQPSPGPTDDSRERFAEALHELLVEKDPRDWDGERSRLLARYRQAAQRHKGLRLADGDTKGQAAVGVVSMLAERSPDRVEKQVRKALTGKGFSGPVIQAACEHVREQWRDEP
jgi:hypothetical protein